MGLVPHSVAIAELDADETMKSELRSKVDQWLRGEGSSRIESVEIFESGDERRLVLLCEEEKLVDRDVFKTQMDADCIRVHLRS